MILNIIMIILFAIGSFSYYIFGKIWYSAAVTALLCFSIFILLYAVYRIKKLIAVMEHAVPNEKLMTLHFVNFVSYALLRILKHSFQIAAEKMEDGPHHLLSLKVYFTY